VNKRFVRELDDLGLDFWVYSTEEYITIEISNRKTQTKFSRVIHREQTYKLDEIIEKAIEAVLN